MSNKADVFFGKIAVDQGLASEQDINACMEEIDRLRGQGKQVHLGALLVHRGILDREQVRRVLDRQNKQVLRCPTCAKTYTVMGLPKGKTMRCNDCQTPLKKSDVDVLTRSKPEDSPRVSQLLDSESQLTHVPAELGGDTHTTRLNSDPQEDTILAGGPGDAMLGTTLSGKYRILEKIGQGGMGAVYKARHTLLDRICAVKILPSELAEDESLVARMRQEAKVCARLDQKNVVQIFDVDNDQGFEYMALEFINGQDLEELVKAKRRLPVDQALSIVRQAALGLAAAHAEGIIHRDIKPANLMLTQQGVVKVMDFGLSRLMEAASHLSRTGQILGTPHYMSPEQARGHEVDLRTDIYSLGATFYFTVTGQTPFAASVPTALLLKTISEEPPSANEVNRNVPLALSMIIQKMMSKDREQRYPDLQSCIEDLERHKRGERISVRPPATKLPQLPRQALLIAAGCLALVLIVAGAFAFGMSRRSGPPENGGGGQQTRDNGAEERTYKQLQAILQDANSSRETRIAACKSYLEDFSDSPRATAVRSKLIEYEAAAKPDPQPKPVPQPRSGLAQFEIPVLLNLAERALTRSNLAEARKRLGRLQGGRELLTESQRKRLDQLRSLLALLEQKQTVKPQPEGANLTAAWRRSIRKVRLLAGKYDADLSHLRAFDQALGRWDSSGGRLVGQGVLLSLRGPLRAPTVYTRWEMPAGPLALRSIGVMLSSVPPSGRASHVAIGLRVDDSSLFVTKLIDDGKRRGATLAGKQFSQPIKAGDKIDIRLRTERGNLRLELTINGKPATTLLYRMQPGDLATRGPVFLALFAFGQTTALEKFELEASRFQPRRGRRGRDGR